MYHYTYMITNTTNAKMYIGKRSSVLPPKEDLGKKYFSSSKDEEFMQLQFSNPEIFSYEIINTFNTAKEAVSDEIRLHQLHDVGRNINFYNRCKQTSSSRDTTGMVSLNGKLIPREEFKISDTSFHTKGKVVAINTITGEFVSVSKGIFDASEHLKGVNYKKSIPQKQKDKMSTTLKGRVFTKDHLEKLKIANQNKDFKKIYTPGLKLKMGESSKGRTNHIALKVLYDKSKNYYVFDADNVLTYIITCRFDKICKYNGLPANSLKDSAKNHGRPLYSRVHESKILPVYARFKGWYCLEESDLNT